jgi:hypothetical protein
VEDLERFLTLVGKEVDAHDAHLQLGGRDPTDARSVFVELEPGVRLVVRFAARPAEPGQVRERLFALAQTFDTTVQHATRTTRAVAPGRRGSSQEDLSHALDVLAQRTEAAAIVIIDERSPVVWGHSGSGGAWLELIVAALAQTTSEPPPEEVAPLSGPRDLGGFLLQAVSDARTCAENRLVRTRDGGSATRKFGGIYRLILAFDQSFSPLHVETSVSKAMPAIERLVEGLPPVDPPPSRGRVTQLRPV